MRGHRLQHDCAHSPFPSGGAAAAVVVAGCREATYAVVLWCPSGDASGEAVLSRGFLFSKEPVLARGGGLAAMPTAAAWRQWALRRGEHTSSAATSSLSAYTNGSLLHFFFGATLAQHREMRWSSFLPSGWLSGGQFVEALEEGGRLAGRMLPLEFVEVWARQEADGRAGVGLLRAQGMDSPADSLTLPCVPVHEFQVAAAPGCRHGGPSLSPECRQHSGCHG